MVEEELVGPTGLKVEITMPNNALSGPSVAVAAYSVDGIPMELHVSAPGEARANLLDDFGKVEHSRQIQDGEAMVAFRQSERADEAHYGMAWEHELFSIYGGTSRMLSEMRPKMGFKVLDDLGIDVRAAGLTLRPKRNSGVERVEALVPGFLLSTEKFDLIDIEPMTRRSLRNIPTFQGTQAGRSGEVFKQRVPNPGEGQDEIAYNYVTKTGTAIMHPSFGEDDDLVLTALTDAEMTLTQTG